MPTDRGLQRPDGDRFVVIRESNLRICDNDLCQAALLWAFEYWDGIRRADAEMKESERKLQGLQPNHKGDALIWRSQEDLERDLLGVYERKAISPAVTGLEERGFITRIGHKQGRRGRYRFQRAALQEALDRLPATGRAASKGEAKAETGGAKTRRRSCPKRDKSVVRKGTSHINHHQNTDFNAFCRSSTVVEIGSQPSGAEAMKVAEGRAEPETARKPGRTAEEELRLRLKERHAGNGGLLDLNGIVGIVHDELQKGDTPLGVFLRLDSHQTTGPDRLTNPTGYYRDLARKAVLIGRMRWSLDSTRQFELALAGAPLEPEQPRITLPALPARPPDCATCQCQSKGLPTGRVGADGYCCCKMGRDLERAERSSSGCFAPVGAL